MTVPGPLDLVMGWRDDPSVTPTELLILMILRAHRSRDGGRCDPSRDTLAAEAHVTPRTVRRALSAWVARGVIAPSGARTGGRARATNWHWRDPSEWVVPYDTPPRKGDTSVPVTGEKEDTTIPLYPPKGDTSVPVTGEKGDPGDTKRGIQMTLKGDPGVPRTGKNRDLERGSPPNPPAGGAQVDQGPDGPDWTPPTVADSIRRTAAEMVWLIESAWLSRLARRHSTTPRELAVMVVDCITAVTGEDADLTTIGTDARLVLRLWQRLGVPPGDLPEQIAIVSNHLSAQGDPAARSLRHVTDPTRWGDRIRAARDARAARPQEAPTADAPLSCAVCHGDLEVDCGDTRVPCPWCVRPEVPA